MHRLSLFCLPCIEIKQFRLKNLGNKNLVKLRHFKSFLIFFIESYDGLFTAFSNCIFATFTQTQFSHSSFKQPTQASNSQNLKSVKHFW